MSSNNPPLRPQFPIQPNQNLNNRGAQQVEKINLLAYHIATMECNELNIRSRWVIST